MDKRERDTMKKKNLQRKQRLLAVVLSVMLFAGLLPGSLSQVLAASDEYEDCCTVEAAGDEPDGIYEIEMLKADQSFRRNGKTGIWCHSVWTGSKCCGKQRCGRWKRIWNRSSYLSVDR